MNWGCATTSTYEIELVEVAGFCGVGCLFSMSGFGASRSLGFGGEVGGCGNRAFSGGRRSRQFHGGDFAQRSDNFG